MTQVSPFLVVAPLTTLGHWVREIETWTDLNVVQYTGSGADRWAPLILPVERR